MKVTPIHKSLSAAKARTLGKALSAMAYDSMESVQALSQLGIHISPHAVETYMRTYAGRGMDAAITIPGLTVTNGGTIPALAQFLQSWLPGQVQAVVAPRRADDIMGVTTAGAWEDAEIVQEMLELVGVAQLYGDLNNVPLSSWNVGYERRGVVRFEEGLQVGELEAARAGRININSAETKRRAAALALDIARNRVAFSGFNTGDTLPVYGFLNDPGLPAYVNVAAGAAGGTQWNTKTRNEIIKDLLTAISAIRSKSVDAIDPSTAPMTLLVASDKYDYLSTPDTGAGAANDETPLDWLKKNYPNITAAPLYELNDVNAGADVFYLFADSVADSGTDDGAAFVQIVPARFRALGIDTSCKVITEDFTNATAGVMVKRPYAVYRASGI